VLDLNTNPSNLEGFGTPASFNGAWTKHRCRAEGSATRRNEISVLCERVRNPSEFFAAHGYFDAEARAASITETATQIREYISCDFLR